MNRLWVRLTLACMGVTLLSVLSVAILTDFNADQAFRQYIGRQEMVGQSGLLDVLATFYQNHGNWNGVEALFSDQPGPGMGRGGRGRPALRLADASGHIAYDQHQTQIGTLLTADERAKALPIVVKGQTVGYLVVGAVSDGTMPPAAQQFLDQLRMTLIFVALAVSSLGMLLSILISHTLAAPLSRLAQAARAFAAHDWKSCVKVGGTDEVAAVGRAFNAMASQLQHTETLRRHMMTDIAHELRTPLTVMQGTLQAILDEVYPLERSEIAVLYDETRLLVRLVDDLRELSLADAGQLPLQFQEVDVASILQATAMHFSFAAQARQISLTVHLQEPLPYAHADPDRVAQVMRNLVVNALQHTSTGGKIQLSAVAETHLTLSVSDSGEGIAAADVTRVFERFYRVQVTNTHPVSSTGLGLAICKALIGAMGGEIGVESVQGRGSRFWFTLPLSQATQETTMAQGRQNPIP